MCLFAVGALSFALPSPGAAQPIGSDIHVDVWTGLTNQYIFRGLPQVNQGGILRGGIEGRADFYNDGWFRVSMPAAFSMVLSPKERSEGIPNVPRAWYESRFGAGLVLGFGGVALDSRFRIYSSPNGSFKDVYELDFTLKYDDQEDWTGGDEAAVWRGLAPYAQLAREMVGARDGGVEGTYVEVGMAPQLHIFEGGALLGVNLLVPASLGFSAGDYYEVGEALGALEDRTFGYASVGAVLDIESRFMPRRLGIFTGGLDVRAVFPVAANQAPDEMADDGTNLGNGVSTVEWVIVGYSTMAF